MEKIKVLEYNLANDCFNNIINKKTGEIVVKNSDEVY